MAKVQVPPWVGLLGKYRDTLFFMTLGLGNALLAHGPFPLTTKLSIGLVLFLLPLCWAFGSALREKSAPLLADPKGPRVAGWAWGAVLAACLFPRFYTLFFPPWPIPDEGAYSLISMELSRQWTWEVLLTEALDPPLFNWVAALWIKVFPAEIPSLRLLVFLFSVLSVGLAALACRTFFRPWLAFLVFSFFSLGFWPLLTFKQVLFLCVTVPLQLTAFWLWGKVRSSSSPLLGAAWGGILGLGCWGAIPWLLVPLALLPLWLRTRPFSQGRSAWVLVPFALGTLSYAFFVLTHGGFQHVLWLISHEATANGFGRLRSVLSNGTCLLWEGVPGTPFSPVRGGLLNPLEGAFFVLGLLALLRSRRDPLSLWFSCASFLFLLPGLLTSGYVSFHNILFIPFTAVFCGLGARAVLKEWRSSWSAKGFAGVVVLSALLNGVHFLSSFRPLPAPPPFSQVAFQTLQGLQREKGPGYLLWGLSPEGPDPILASMTYPFNAARNPRWEGKEASWGCFLVNSNYRPFLDRRWKGIQWKDLGPDVFWHQGRRFLAVLAWEPGTCPLPDWIALDREWQDLERKKLFHPQDTTDFLTSLSLTREGAKKDPILSSLYWEKRVFHSQKDRPLSELYDALERSVEEGPGTAHLLTALGILDLGMGRTERAQRRLREAMRVPGQDTQAADLLKTLEGKGPAGQDRGRP